MSVLGGRSASRSRGRSAKFELILTTRCQYWGVDLPADVGVDLPNLSSQTFRCGHYRGLFVLHMKDQLETVPVPIVDQNDRVQSYTHLQVKKPYIA